jgi:hypothetical protein
VATSYTIVPIYFSFLTYLFSIPNFSYTVKLKRKRAFNFFTHSLQLLQQRIIHKVNHDATDTYITGLKRPDRNIAHDYNRGSDTVKNSIPNFFKGVKIKKSHLSSFLLIYFPFSPLPPALQFKPFPNFRQLKKTNLLFNNSHPFSSIFLKFYYMPSSHIWHTFCIIQFSCQYFFFRNFDDFDQYFL